MAIPTTAATAAATVFVTNPHLGGRGGDRTIYNENVVTSSILLHKPKFVGRSVDSDRDLFEV